MRQEKVEGLQKVEGQQLLPFSSSGFFQTPPTPKQENASSLRDEAEGFEKSLLSHLIGDVAEGVWKNSLLSKVIRLETGEDLLVFD